MFPATRHTLLRSAVAPTTDQPEALNALLEIYWHPCYRYVMRRFRTTHEEAQDLVQGFFALFVEQEILGRYDSGRGNFRPYLRTRLDQFVLNDFQRKRAEKRGGRALLLSLDQETASSVSSETPEQIFHREWQRHMFRLAVEDLRELCDGTGRRIRFEIFVGYDLAEDLRPGYEELAAAHKLPVTAVTNHLAWARRELRRLLELRLEGITKRQQDRKRELHTLLTSRSS